MEKWQIAIASPELEVSDLRSFELQDTQALLLERVRH
ncbi:hypothetical protein [Coleofasciculus sp. E1-EBD-02]